MALIDGGSTRESESLLDDCNNISKQNNRIKLRNIIDATGNNRLLQNHLLILGLCNSADAIEITSFGYMLNLIKLEDGSLVAQDRFWGGALTASVFCGMLFGGFFCGYLSDKFGRRNVLLYCMFINFIGAVCSSITVFFPFYLQMYWLLSARFLAGLGVGGTIPSVFTLCTEISPRSLKSQSINFVASFWMIGLFYTAAMALLLLSNDAKNIKNETDFKEHWPIFALLAGLPAGLASVTVYFYCLKSPCFLLKQNKIDEVIFVLTSFLDTRLQKNEKNLLSYVPKESHNNSTYSSVTENHTNEEIFELIEGLELEKSVFSVTETEETLKFTESVSSLVSSDLRLTVLLLTVTWFTLSFASYGLLSWIATLFTTIGFADNPYTPSMYFALASLPGNIFALLLSPKLGSANLLTLSLFLSCFFLFFSLDESSKTRIIIGATGFQCFSTAAWNALDAISTENFPTKVRGFAFGTLSSAGRIGGISAGFFDGEIFSSNAEHGGMQILFYNAVIIGIGCVAISLLKIVTKDRVGQ